MRCCARLHVDVIAATLNRRGASPTRDPLAPPCAARRRPPRTASAAARGLGERSRPRRAVAGRRRARRRPVARAARAGCDPAPGAALARSAAARSASARPRIRAGASRRDDGLAPRGASPSYRRVVPSRSGATHRRGAGRRIAARHSIAATRGRGGAVARPSPAAATPHRGRPARARVTGPRASRGRPMHLAGSPWRSRSAGDAAERLSGSGRRVRRHGVPRVGRSRRASARRRRDARSVARPASRPRFRQRFGRAESARTADRARSRDARPRCRIPTVNRPTCARLPTRIGAVSRDRVARGSRARRRGHERAGAAHRRDPSSPRAG